MLIILLVAGLAMLIQNVLGVLTIQAEARNRTWLAGILDSFCWFCSISTTTISVTTLQGHDFGKKVIVVAMVTVANLLGTALGVTLGRKLVKEDEPPATPHH